MGWELLRFAGFEDLLARNRSHFYDAVMCVMMYASGDSQIKYLKGGICCVLHAWVIGYTVKTAADHTSSSYTVCGTPRVLDVDVMGKMSDHNGPHVSL